MVNETFTWGDISIGEPSSDGSVCSVKLTSDDGFYGTIDLSPASARALALQILARSGVVVPNSMAISYRH